MKSSRMSRHPPAELFSSIRRVSYRHARVVLAVTGLALAATVARADLTDPRVLNQLSPLEQRAAIANQGVYSQLTGANGGTVICNVQQRTASGACTGAVFETFENVRELVQTSNELVGSGPTAFSLGLDAEGLGFALRWSAAEELAAQGSSATQFSNSQLGTLASRLAALRFSAGGSRVASLSATGAPMALATTPRRGGGASADDSNLVKRWGVFVDGSFGYGRKGDTTFAGQFEDAFDFDGKELSIGVDYRLNNAVVIGLIAGYSTKQVDFDSRVSVVDGTLDSDGQSLIAYAQWEFGKYYLSGSLGSQWLAHDFVRRINYPSLNPLVAPVDETARSDTDSTALLATFGAGAGLNFGAFGVEPYIKGEIQNISVDGFTERGARGFDFTYGDQDIKSFDVAAGVKLQFVWTPRFGVVVPFVRGEYHQQLQDEPRTINAVYSAVSGIGFSAANNPDFALKTDQRDDDYIIVAGGFSLVLKHGLQGFVNYQQVIEFENFSDRVISGGVRFEF